jgi:hypothetical protein
MKFRKNKFKGGIEQVPQIRVNPSEMANTILKMAKKRSLIDAVLTSTAASDCFSQDLEDLPEGILPDTGTPVPSVPEPVREESFPTPGYPSQASQNAPTASDGWETMSAQPVDEIPVPMPPQAKPAGNVISEAQRKRFFAICKGAGMPDDAIKRLTQQYGFEHSRDITREKYEDICSMAESYNPVGAK